MTRDLYASAMVTAALLRAGRQHLHDRIRAADMIAVGEVASLMGVDEATVGAWVRSGRCIGVADRAMAFPRWQFGPSVWPSIQRISESLGTKDGWQVLNFLETPAPALDGLTPRVALERGIPVSRVLDVAMGDAH